MEQNACAYWGPLLTGVIIGIVGTVALEAALPTEEELAQRELQHNRMRALSADAKKYAKRSNGAPPAASKVRTGLAGRLASSGW